MTMTLFVMCFLIVGIVSAFTLSVFCLFFPNILIKLNQWASQAILSTEENVIKNRKTLGILMLVFGIFLTYVVVSTPLDLFPELKK